MIGSGPTCYSVRTPTRLIEATFPYEVQEDPVHSTILTFFLQIEFSKPSFPARSPLTLQEFIPPVEFFP